MVQLTKLFDGQQLRMLNPKDNETFFLLNDVCSILSLAPRTVRQRLTDDVCSTYPIRDSLGRTQQATFVNEDGLYDVILDSRKPEAKRFRKWVTSEVIPSIRKHGAYMTPEKIEEVLLNPDTIIKLATELKTEREQRQQLEHQQQIDAPYTTFGKVVSSSDASINIGAFAKMMYDKHGIKLGRNKMFEWLRQKGFLIRAGRERNNPKQKYIEQGLFETTVTLVSRTQGDVESITTLITGKGQVRIAEMLTKEYGVMIS
ncbi:phage antirepressor [Paucisalibacillus globulus]|uniref:phage antirepressor n=1 Tax=Paucisalibacillus globulus TaxID=351095 RepID=UPI0020D15D29|nr:phage antirepressor KilAC domain-containing protein [Paucisalibacillus globulus]